MTSPAADILVQNEGSLFLFRPASDAGREFIAEHAPDDAMYFGTALVVEHRYAETWYEGAIEEGLVVA